MDGPAVPPRNASPRDVSSAPSSPVLERKKPSITQALRSRFGRKIGKLSNFVRHLRGNLETKRSSSLNDLTSVNKEIFDRGIKKAHVEPSLSRSISMPAIHDTPHTASDVATNIKAGFYDGDSGDSALYSLLLKPDFPYTELRQLAWTDGGKLSGNSLHTVRLVWAVRKAGDFLGKHKGIPPDQAKFELANELSKRKVPGRYILEAVTATDMLSRSPSANVKPEIRQVFYFINSGKPEVVADSQKLAAFSQNVEQMVIRGEISEPRLAAMAQDIQRTSDLDDMPVDLSLLQSLTHGPSERLVPRRSGPGRSQRPEQPRPTPKPRRRVPDRTPARSPKIAKAITPGDAMIEQARQYAGKDSQLRLNHTPSLDATERVRLESEYGVKTIPIKIGGKEVAYIFTSSPDGKPKNRVFLSSHGQGWHERPKFQKNPATTMLFAGVRDNVLKSRTATFANGLASGRARFEDDSQIYGRIQREVTDYALDGSISTQPAMAAQQLAKFRDEGAVNDFDYLLIDRNVKGLHMSDLMQALQDAGITHTQMINHICRPQTDHAGIFSVRKTFEDDGVLNLSTIDPDLGDGSPSTPPPPVPRRRNLR
ncbi:hypothetical protein [Parendozoicomonas sp. Alg238-R29]|uniref:hypothetical protein n=1 Tax=Parendozoicomonas sp. Alg238-R29 TaxID=2993446 RepID=UPI00248E5A84|nr:hypothetical protein [Parendozoicomonas sp. Alg238-R29]